MSSFEQEFDKESGELVSAEDDEILDEEIDLDDSLELEESIDE